MARVLPGRTPLFPGNRRTSVWGVFLDGELKAARKHNYDAWRLADKVVAHLDLNPSEWHRVDVRWVDEPAPEPTEVELKLQAALDRMRKLEGYDATREVEVVLSRCGHSSTMSQSRLDHELAYWTNELGQLRCGWCGKYGMPVERSA